MKREIFNSEGYADYTAYEAIRKVTERDIMKKGDIVSVDCMGCGRKVVVIQSYTETVLYLMLLRRLPEENGISITTEEGNQYYLDVSKVNFKYKTNCNEIYGDDEEHISKETLDRITKAVGASMGFTSNEKAVSDTAYVEKVKELEQALNSFATAQNELENARSELETMKRLNDKLSDEIERLENELNSRPDASEELIREKTRAQIFESLYKEAMGAITK